MRMNAFAAAIAAAAFGTAVRSSYGPRVTATKDIGRNYLKSALNSRRYKNGGKQERERRARHIAKGQIREANGLVRAGGGA